MRSLAEKTALELLDAWNRRDLEGFEHLLSENVSWYDPSMTNPPAVGRSAVMVFARAVLKAFPEFRYHIRGPICVSADDTTCCIPWRVTAVQSADFDPPGFAPTGRAICVEGLDYVTVTDGLVSKIETFFDPLAAAESTFGIVLRPRSGSLSERLLVRIQRLRAWWLRGHRAQ